MATAIDNSAQMQKTPFVRELASSGERRILNKATVMRARSMGLY